MRIYMHKYTNYSPDGRYREVPNVALDIFVNVVCYLAYFKR